MLLFLYYTFLLKYLTSLFRQLREKESLEFSRIYKFHKPKRYWSKI